MKPRQIRALAAAKVDFEKFRLRRFVEHLIDLGEVEIHDERRR